MDTDEKTINEEILCNIHQSQLKNGNKNDEKQKEIIDIFGGIDEMVSIALKSGANLNQTQINKLHNIFINPNKKKQTKIITKPSKDDEEKKYNKITFYSFDDEDIIWFKLVNEQRAKQILSILNSKYPKFVLLFMIMISGTLLSILNKNNMVYIYDTVMWIIIMLYVCGWILYANTRAMKLLLNQFVFIFKLCYLIVFIVSSIWINYVAKETPMFYIVVLYLAFGALLLLLMIFDAINVSQTNKILVSTLTVALFSLISVKLWQREYYPNVNATYQKAKISINTHYIFGEIDISLLSIASNSAWNLTIFLWQQVMLTIFYPTKALVIKSKTFIEYKNNKEKTPTAKHIKKSRVVTILFTVISVMFSLRIVFANTMPETFIVYTVNACVFIILLGLLIRNNMKSIKTGGIIWFVLGIINGIAALIFNLDPIGTCGVFIGFGLISWYSLKLQKWKASNLSNTMINNYNNQRIEMQSDVDVKMEEEYDTNTMINNYNNQRIVPIEIEMKDVKNDNKCTKIDRTESISSVNLNTGE